MKRQNESSKATKFRPRSKRSSSRQDTWDDFIQQEVDHSEHGANSLNQNKNTNELLNFDKRSILSNPELPSNHQEQEQEQTNNHNSIKLRHSNPFIKDHFHKNPFYNSPRGNRDSAEDPYAQSIKTFNSFLKNEYWTPRKPPLQRQDSQVTRKYSRPSYIPNNANTFKPKESNSNSPSKSDNDRDKLSERSTSPSFINGSINYQEDPFLKPNEKTYKIRSMIDNLNRMKEVLGTRGPYTNHGVIPSKVKKILEITELNTENDIQYKDSKISKKISKKEKEHKSKAKQKKAKQVHQINQNNQEINKYEIENKENKDNLPKERKHSASSSKKIEKSAKNSDIDSDDEINQTTTPKKSTSASKSKTSDSSPYSISSSSFSIDKKKRKSDLHHNSDSSSSKRKYNFDSSSIKTDELDENELKSRESHIHSKEEQLRLLNKLLFEQDARLEEIRKKQLDSQFKRKSLPSISIRSSMDSNNNTSQISNSMNKGKPIRVEIKYLHEEVNYNEEIQSLSNSRIQQVKEKKEELEKIRKERIQQEYLKNMFKLEYNTKQAQENRRKNSMQKSLESIEKQKEINQRREQVLKEIKMRKLKLQREMEKKQKARLKRVEEMQSYISKQESFLNEVAEIEKHEEEVAKRRLTENLYKLVDAVPPKKRISDLGFVK